MLCRRLYRLPRRRFREDNPSARRASIERRGPPGRGERGERAAPRGERVRVDEVRSGPSRYRTPDLRVRRQSRDQRATSASNRSHSSARCSQRASDALAVLPRVRPRAHVPFLRLRRLRRRDEVPFDDVTRDPRERDGEAGPRAFDARKPWNRDRYPRGATAFNVVAGSIPRRSAASTSGAQRAATRATHAKSLSGRLGSFAGARAFAEVSLHRSLTGDASASAIHDSNVVAGSIPSPSNFRQRPRRGLQRTQDGARVAKVRGGFVGRKDRRRHSNASTATGLIGGGHPVRPAASTARRVATARRRSHSARMRAARDAVNRS